MGTFPSPDTFPATGVWPAPPTLIRSGPSGAGEVEILAGRRAFATAQALFAGGPVAPSQRLGVGWHGTSVNPETGSFAVVQRNAGLDDLIGEIVRITSNGRVVFAYVLDDADVPVQVSVTRRLFLVLNRLTIDALPADVVAVGG